VPKSSEAWSGVHAEWLKLKGYLYDPITDLPALPAVIEGVRRRLEAGETIGLLYLDLSHGGRLEPITGWQLHDRMIGEVARALTGSSNGHFDERDAVALVGVRSDEFVLFAGLDGDESQSHLERLHRWLSATVERAVEPLRSAELEHWPSVQSAGVRLEVEPKMRIERAIYRGLELAREICRRQAEKEKTGRLAELLQLLDRRELTIRYQPIVRLADGTVHGYEALALPHAGGGFETAEMLFTFAEESGRVVELDRLCRREALASAAGLCDIGGGIRLFLNASAPAFGEGDFAAELAEGAREVGLEPREIVVEVTERVAITEWRAFRRCLTEIRRHGIEVAIDDMGSGYSSLQAVAEIEPDYLKFDCSLTLDVHRSRIKRDLLESLVHLAGKIGARTVAEGLEGVEEFEAVCAMGIEYGQGYLFARPAAAEEAGAIFFPTTSPSGGS